MCIFSLITKEINSYRRNTMPQVKVIATETRPSLDVDFYSSKFSEEANLYLIEHYINTGKLISQEVTYSDDRLSKTGIRVFDSPESRVELTNDPFFAQDKADRIDYNAANSITVNIVTEFLP